MIPTVTGSCSGYSYSDWLVEGLPGELPALVVSAIVTNGQVTTVPLCLINATQHSITVRARFKIAQLTKLDPHSTVNSVENYGGNQHTQNISEKKQLDLWEMVEQGSKALSESQQQQLYGLLLNFSDVFADGDEDLGRTQALTHSIDTGSSPPMCQQARRLPVHQRNKVKNLLNDMLDRDVIQPSRLGALRPLQLW